MPFSWTLIEEELYQSSLPTSEGDVARDFRLDPLTRDLVVSPGMQLVQGLEAIAQNLFLRISMFKGEWFLNTDEGTDWFGSILVKNPDLNLVRSILRERILGTAGVLDLLELETTLDAGARQLRTSWRVTTDLGALKQVAEVTAEI